MLGALGEVCEKIALYLCIGYETGNNNACFFVAEAGDEDFANGGEGGKNNIGGGVCGMGKGDAPPVGILFVGFVEGIGVQKDHHILCAGFLFAELIGTTGGIV